MSDRINAITVVLKDDVREDDAQGILNALTYLKGVISVTPNVSNIEDHIAHSRAKHELITKIYEVLQ